jgi:hypothetical protein
MLQTLAQEVQLMVNGQSEVSLEEGVDTIKHLTTDTVNTAHQGVGKVILRPFISKLRIQRLLSAYQTAIAN